jgi:hypothetical protein
MDPIGERPDGSGMPPGRWRHVGDRLSPLQRSLIVAGVVLVAALIVFRFVSPSLADYLSTKAGDCLAADPAIVLANVAGQVRTVPGDPYAETTGCDRQHVHEVMGLPELAGDRGAPYPVDTVAVAAAGACTELFATYVGRPLEGSSLAATAYYPDRAEWEEQDSRKVVCVVVDPATGTVVGSLRGSAR